MSVTGLQPCSANAWPSLGRRPHRRFCDKSLNTRQTICRRDAAHSLPRYCAKPDGQASAKARSSQAAGKNHGGNSMLDKAPNKKLSDLLDKFGAALVAGDIDKAVACFQEDCYWRDLVSFT